MKYLKKFEGIDDIEKLSGWINVKIDDQLFIRMSRYVLALDSLCKKAQDKYNLFMKIDILSDIDNYINKNDIDIQTKISIITLLQYLNELKTQFNASSAGFLLEGFLACLIHGKVIPGYKEADMSSSYSELDPIQFKTTHPVGGGSKKLNYQIKLYARNDSKNKGGNIKIKWEKLCDYYVICLKNTDSTIDVHILTRDINDKDSYIGNFVANIGGVQGDFIRDAGKRTQHILLNTNKLYTRGKSHKFMRKLDIKDSTIEKLILVCGKSVKNSIEKVYNNLSELHYDVDSLVSGVDKNKVNITTDIAKDRADKTIVRISKDISKLQRDIG